jgi:ketosteroid isomerase-like protein
MSSSPFVRAIIFFAALVLGPAIAVASDEVDDLARDLIDRFYDALAPDNPALAEFLGNGFQIIGSDGLRFDRNTYLTFPKAITGYEITDLVAHRDGDVLTATFEVGYKGEFEGATRTVPRLARLAVFSETEDGWKLQALAALGTGENDISGKAAEVVTRWLAANASGDAAAIRQLASPDFQLQRPDGSGVALADFLKGARAASRPPAVEDLVATSFSNTMIARYKLERDGKTQPRLTVFQRINGEWRAAADAEYRSIE